MTTKTFEDHFNDWKRGDGAKFDGMDERAMLDIFAAGFWIGFESARKTAMAGIAQALAPEGARGN